jgi:hypothetical protein
MSRTQMMASAASLSNLSRAPSGKKAQSDAERRGTPNATNQSPSANAEDDKENEKDKEDDKDTGKKGKKNGKAEGDDEDDEDDEDNDKSQAVTDDDDGDRADASNPVTRAARERERNKMAAILESPAGKAAFKANPEKVVRFMIGYPGSRKEAIATLELFGGSSHDKSNAREETPLLRDRMNTTPVPVASPDASGSDNMDGITDAAAMIIAADKIRRGGK